MDNYNGAPRGDKEKSVYLLHLDTPRIIIISSVVIGIMVIAFLVGMNLKADGEKGREGSSKDLALDLPMDINKNQNKSGAPLADPLENGLTNPALEKQNSALPNDKNALPGNQDLAAAGKSNTNAAPAGDVLTNENIKEIIPPAKSTVKASRKSAVAKASKEADDESAEPVKRKGKKKKKTKNRVVEVASKKDRESDEKKPARSHKGNYAIQIASFDSSAKAHSEVRNLKRQRFDAYIDKSTIRGKKYYRVKIGPILSKQKAVRLLNEIQENKKYEESYMIKE